MTKIAVTPHPGARKWLYKNVTHIDEFVDEIDIKNINAGDQIYGELPVHLAAAICDKGAEFYHLSTSPHHAMTYEFEQFKLAQPKLEKFYINSLTKPALPALVKSSSAKLAAKFKRIKKKHLGIRKADIKLALYALLTAAGVASFADALSGILLFQNQLQHWFDLDKEWFKQHYTIYWIIELGFGLCLFMWASWALRLQAKNWIPIRDVKRQAEDKRYAGLILSLSSGFRFEHKQGDWFFIKQKYGDPIEVKLSGDLEQDIQLLEPLKIQWELILRTIRSQAVGHDALLQRVSLLGSQDCSIKNREGKVERISPGTYPFISNALKVLSIYPEFKNICFEHYPVPIPPNDIEAYYNAYLKIANNWVDNHKLQEEEILIDITGGKSLNSVAAALATLHNKMQFQYVDTNNLNDVLVYKMEYRQQNI